MLRNLLANETRYGRGTRMVCRCRVPWDLPRTRPPLVPEPPQAGAALAKAVDDSQPSEAHLRHLLDTLPILASCHLPDGSNAFCNQRWHDYTGLSPEEAHGWGWKAPIHPEDLGKLMEYLVTSPRLWRAR